MFNLCPSSVWNPSAMLSLVLLIVLGLNAVPAVNISVSVTSGDRVRRTYIDSTPADPENHNQNQYGVSYKNSSLFTMSTTLPSLNRELEGTSSKHGKDKPHLTHNPQSHIVDNMNNQLYVAAETNLFSPTTDKREKDQSDSLNDNVQTTMLNLMELKDGNSAVRADIQNEINHKQGASFKEGDDTFSTIDVRKTHRNFDEKETLSVGEQRQMLSSKQNKFDESTIETEKNNIINEMTKSEDVSNIYSLPSEKTLFIPERTVQQNVHETVKSNSYYTNNISDDKNEYVTPSIKDKVNNKHSKETGDQIQLKSVTLNPINPETNYKSELEETITSSETSVKINDYSKPSVQYTDAKTHFQLDSTHSLNSKSPLSNILYDKGNAPKNKKMTKRRSAKHRVDIRFQRDKDKIENASVSNLHTTEMSKTVSIERFQNYGNNRGSGVVTNLPELNSSIATSDSYIVSNKSIAYKDSFNSTDNRDSSIKVHREHNTMSKIGNQNSPDLTENANSILKLSADVLNYTESSTKEMYDINVSTKVRDVENNNSYIVQNDMSHTTISVQSSILDEVITIPNVSRIEGSHKIESANKSNLMLVLSEVDKTSNQIKYTESYSTDKVTISVNDTTSPMSTIKLFPTVPTIEPDGTFLTTSDIYIDEIYENVNSSTVSTVPTKINGEINGNYSEVPTEDYTEFMSSDVPISPSSNSGDDGVDNITGVSGVINSGSSDSSASTSSASSDVNQWPVKHAAVVEGDLVLGGLMMVHEREDFVTCGPVMPQGGVQALEAMLYTLDKVNDDPHFLPNITLGAHILDDCDKDTYGLEMAVDFIKGSISNIDGAEYHCNKTQVRKVISGVVGAASSVTSIQVANLLRLFKIPQVSFFSTSPELSNKQRFEFFSRTIPSDHYQVKAMVDIVMLLKWSYVSIIYEESNYGIKAFEELEELLAKHNICIAVKEKLVKDSGVAEEIAYDNIVQKLLTKTRARGCIIFGSDQEVAGVMRAVRRSNATGSFSWIGSDGWSARSLVSNGNEAEVEGTLSVQPKANPVKGFEEYFLSLTVENNRRNPWFVEFWEDHFHCRYPNSSWTPYKHKYTKMCTTKEKLTKQNTVFEDQLQFVSDAVMAFAHAIKDMHKELCRGGPGLCDIMKPTKGTDLLKYLRTVEFEGLSGDHFKFDSNGDGPARYNIIHFKQVSLGKYRWIRVGEYIEGELRLNMSEVQFKLGHPKPPESVCSLPCDLGQAKKYVEGESCCWHCFNCTQYQIRHPLDETQCVSCPQGKIPDIYHVHCNEIPEVYLRPNSGWAIGAMTASTSGILVTLFVFGVFIKFNDTPVVRASGRELSYVLLVGILMCYCVTYVLVMRPTDIVCGLQRFGAGFCFTVVYAALFTKTNRIARIFNAGKHSAKRPSFISPRSQLIICSGLVFIQVLINGIWMLLSPARAIHHYPTREDNLLVCSSYIDASYMIAFTYPIFLIVVCTVYAILTRKIPEAFNESKFIGFTMYTTCVIWLAFVPLYFGTANHVALRITSMSVTISLSASVTVICLFSPKLYIILIRPERNVRQSMMPARYSVVNNRTATTNSGAGSMMAAVMVTAATCNQKEKIDKHVPPNSEQDLELVENKKEKIDKSTQTVSVLHARIVDPPVKINNAAVLTNDSVSKINNTSTAAVLVANSMVSSNGPPIKINNNMATNNNSKTETIGNGPLVMQTNQTTKDVAL